MTKSKYIERTYKLKALTVHECKVPGSKVKATLVVSAAELFNIAQEMGEFSYGPNIRIPDPDPNKLRKVGPYRAMVEQLETAPEGFHEKNGGMRLIVRDLDIDGDSVTFTCEERKEGTTQDYGHGLMNGGHTYRALLDACAAYPEKLKKWKDDTKEYESEKAAAKENKKTFTKEAPAEPVNPRGAYVDVNIYSAPAEDVPGICFALNNISKVDADQEAAHKKQLDDLRVALGIRDKLLKNPDDLGRVDRLARLVATVRKGRPAGSPRASAAKHEYNQLNIDLGRVLINPIKVKTDDGEETRRGVEHLAAFEMQASSLFEGKHTLVDGKNILTKAPGIAVLSVLAILGKLAGANKPEELTAEAFERSFERHFAKVCELYLQAFKTEQDNGGDLTSFRKTKPVDTIYEALKAPESAPADDAACPECEATEGLKLDGEGTVIDCERCGLKGLKEASKRAKSKSTRKPVTEEDIPEERKAS